MKRSMKKYSKLFFVLFILIPISSWAQELSGPNINVRYNYASSPMTSYTVNLIQNKLVELVGPHFPGEIAIH